MNQEIKARWIAALRSGEYKQTKHVLNDGTGMCCLGVLCDLYAKDHNEKWLINPWGKSLHLEGSTPGQTLIPDSRVVYWAGIEDANPCLGRIERNDISTNEDAGNSYLASLNDFGLTFDQMADVINHFL